MSAILAYFRRRAAERSTWIGLALIGVAVAVLWSFREQIFTAATVAAVGSALSALPGRLLRLSPSTPAAGEAASPLKEPTAMSAVSTIEEILDEAPDFIAVGKDLTALAAAIEAKDLAGILAAIKASEPDIVKAYNDVLALGVAKAIAAGTVTPAAPAATAAQ